LGHIVFTVWWDSGVRLIEGTLACLLDGEGEGQDSVVSGVWGSSEGVAGDQPEPAVGRCDHGAQASVLALQEALGFAGSAMAAQGDSPQGLTSQGGHVDGAVCANGDPAG
jgi:hypothetical protein